MKKRRVVLYGRSVILGSVGASLRGSPELEIIPLLSPRPTMQELEEHTPDVILFDAQADRPEAAFSLLEIQPGLLLISIDPSSNQVRLWSGQQLHELSTQGLVKIIQERSGGHEEDQNPVDLAGPDIERLYDAYAGESDRAGKNGE